MCVHADIGCLAKYSYFGKFFFAFLVVPVLLSATTIVYFLRRKKTEGIVDRCIKMALSGLFLSESRTRTPARLLLCVSRL